MYAKYLIYGDRVGLNVKEAQSCFRLACDQGSSAARMADGIALLSGLLGRFDFAKARNQFEKAPSSNRFAVILRDSLSLLRDDLVSVGEFSKSGTVFSLLRDGQISSIRIMNPHLCEMFPVQDRVNGVWRNMARACINYLRTLSHLESTVLSSLPIDLASCEPFPEMIPLIFKMYSIEPTSYRNVNRFFRQFPIQILGKCLKEFDGILNYIYLLQSSIHYCACKWPIAEDQVVYRGLSSGGSELDPLYTSLIGQIIVWKGFTSTSNDIECAMRDFVRSSKGILFEMILCPGPIAAARSLFSSPCRA
jgi:hypothetical protein